MFWIKLGLCVYIPKQCHNVIMEMILPPFLSLHYLLLCNCGPCLMLHYPFILNLNYNLCCVESVHKIWCKVLTSQLTTISFFNFETFCLKIGSFVELRPMWKKKGMKTRNMMTPVYCCNQAKRSSGQLQKCLTKAHLEQKFGMLRFSITTQDQLLA